MNVYVPSNMAGFTMRREPLAIYDFHKKNLFRFRYSFICQIPQPVVIGRFDPISGENLVFMNEESVFPKYSLQVCTLRRGTLQK